MPDVKPLIEYSRFSGINNVDEATRLKPVRTDDEGLIHPLQTATNLEIDNSRGLRIRPGTDLKVTATSPHSLWSDGAAICLFVEGTTIYQLNADYSVTIVVEHVPPGLKTRFVRAANYIFFTNGASTAYLEVDAGNSLTYNLIPSPDMTSKAPLPAGRYIEYYRGRVYVAKDDVLWFSDPMAWFRVDMRRGFKRLNGTITMVRAVKEGLYVADGKVKFLRGDSPTEFIAETCLPYNAIPDSDMLISGTRIGTGEDQEEYAVFVTDQGVCVGDSKGNVRNLTEERYVLGSYTSGASLAMDEGNVSRIITALQQ